MNDKMNHAMDEIDNKYLSEAEGYRRRRRPHLISAIAALLVVIYAFVAIPYKYGEPAPTIPTVQGSYEDVPDSSGILSPDSWELANLVAAPEYPKMAQRPHENNFTDHNEYIALLNAWKENQAAQYDQPADYASDLFGFCRTSTSIFLNTEENSVYSPLNVYMALAMLAETTGGESRRQILQALPETTIDQLREQVGHIWNAHYQDDGVTTLLLANSLWLDDSHTFHQNTANLLAKNYYASSFHGDLGSDAMNQQLQAWLNANTGGLLQEQVQNVGMGPGTAFALASTVYFAADWASEFSPENTQDMTFHCANYDLITPFMRKTLAYGTYYQGTGFGAVCLDLGGENKMWLILPDKNHTAYDLTHHTEEYLRLTMDPDNWPQQYTYRINLSLPKFDVVSEIDLIDGLKQMGIRDVFNPKSSDFSPLTDTPELFVDSANHAARVTIDEEGVLAASFTIFIVAPSSAPNQPPEMDFTLDRPFMFIISSRDNLPLFVGNVVEP